MRGFEKALQNALTARAAAKRAANRASLPPKPPEDPEPPESQGSFPFMDESRRIVRRMLCEAEGDVAGGVSGASGGAPAVGGGSGQAGGVEGSDGDGDGSEGSSGPMKSRDLGRPEGKYFVRKKCPREAIRGIVGQQGPTILVLEAQELPDDIWDVVKNQQVRDWAGIQRKDPKKLGHGSFGVAYTTDDPNVVLKVTTDKDEFDATNRLLAENVDLENVAKFYGVATVTDTKGTPRFWLILLERLYPLDRAGYEEAFADDLFEALARYTNDLVGRSPSQDSKTQILLHNWDAYSPERFQQWLERTVPEPDPADYEGGVQDSYYQYDANMQRQEEEDKGQWRILFEVGGIADGLSIDVISALAQLQEHGIDFYDVHGGNVMADKNGTVKVMDLGVSQTAGPTIRLTPVIKLGDEDA
jgi:hypothetical protein